MQAKIEASENEILDNVYLWNGVIANKNTIYLTGYFDLEDEEDYDYDEDSDKGYYDDVDSTRRPRRPIYKYQRDVTPDSRLQLVTTLQSFKSIKAEMSYYPKEQCVIYDNGKSQISIEDMKVTIEDDKSERALTKSRCIDGKMHIAKCYRRVVVRNEQGDLDQITHNMYESHELNVDGKRDFMDVITKDGFQDIDGFDASHLYAVGGKGDVWRCTHGEWIRCGFPSNLPLDTVCCGEDGLVYVSVKREGITFVGKEDTWTQLENPNLSLGFKNLVWHDGKVWATNDWGIWWITPEGITKAEVPDGVYCCAGRMHANAGMLLVVGINGAALHVDGEWELLIQ